jgi:hypothetical protein
LDGQQLLKAVAVVSSTRFPSSRKSDYERMGISNFGGTPARNPERFGDQRDTKRVRKCGTVLGKG